MNAHINVISSMATRALLADLAQGFEAQTGVAVRIVSVGGVDAAQRVQAGEAFDVVCLAHDALLRLAQAGHVQAQALVAYVRSPVAMAVPQGQPMPALSCADDVRRAVENAPSVGYSTGPSGQALAQWLARWGLADAVAAKLKVPPPGTPVGAWVASGEIALGFQQRAELLHVSGVTVVGNFPDDMAMTTVFSAALGRSSCAEAASFLAYLNSPQADALKPEHGMAPY